MSKASLLLKQIQKLQPQKGHYKCYQGYEKIGLKGQRPVEGRFVTYNLASVLDKNSVVLDLGSNIGCMSLYIAERVREVHGIEFYKQFVDISNLIKAHLNVTNCFFHYGSFMSYHNPYKFDVILSLAVHPPSIKGFVALMEKVYIPMLKSGGYLIFEGRYFKKPRPTFDQYISILLSRGFTIHYRGFCQHHDSEGKLNEKRNFYIMKWNG